MRIFLIDDNDEFLEVASRYLSSDPLIQVVGQALSAKAGIEGVGQLKPDLVLLDVAMPEMNGFEALRVLKSFSRPPKVVILTLHDTPEYRSTAADLGADGFVTKSEFFEALRPLIHRMFPSSLDPIKERPMKTVLIVDDSKTMRRMIHASLQCLKGVIFLEASSGLEAIEQLALKRIDLIVLDLNMPDMHGMEVLRFVRGHAAYCRIPIVILTTRGDTDSRHAAMEAGSDRYLTKPFSPKDLAAEVLALLSEERTARHE